MLLVEQLLMVVMDTFIIFLRVMELLRSIVPPQQLIVLIIWLLQVAVVVVAPPVEEVLVVVDLWVVLLQYQMLPVLMQL
jgi:hypothetical protein